MNHSNILQLCQNIIQQYTKSDTVTSVNYIHFNKYFMTQTSQRFINYCNDLKTKECSFIELFVPLLDFLNLYETRNNYTNLKHLSELSKLLIVPKTFPKDSGKHSIYQSTFINDQQCNQFYNNYSKFADMIQDNIKHNTVASLKYLQQNYQNIIDIIITQKPQQRIIRCLVNQIIIELTAGLQYNVDVLKAKYNKGKGNKGSNEQYQEVEGLYNTLKTQVMIYLEYLLTHEPFEYITTHFINTVKFQAIFADDQGQNNLVKLLLNRTLYQKQTSTRVSILKLIHKIQRNNIQISEYFLRENGRDIINQLLKDENQVLNIAIQIISYIVRDDSQMSHDNVLKTFSNLSQLTISENRQVRDIYFKTFQLTAMSFYQLFKDLVVNYNIDIEMLPKYVSFILMDQNIQFDKEEFNTFLIETSNNIADVKDNKENLINKPIQNLNEVEIWLIMCIQIINAQSQELSQFSFHLLPAFQLLKNKHLMSLANVNYIISYINETEYKFILTQQPDICNEKTVELYKTLLTNNKVEQLVQLITMGRLQCNDQIIVAVINYLNSFKTNDDQYTLDHLQLVFYLILLTKKQGNYNQELFNQFFKLVSIILRRYFTESLTIDWIFQHDNQQKVQLIMQVLAGIIRGFSLYLNIQKQLKMVYEQYLQCFLKLYQLKYEIYDKMDQSTQEEEKEQCLYINQGIDILFQQTVSLCAEQKANLEFALSICCLDAPVLRKQFNIALGGGQIDLLSVSAEVYKYLCTQKAIQQTSKLTLQAVLLDFRKLFSTAFKAKSDQEGLERFKGFCDSNGIFLRGKPAGEASGQEQNQEYNQKQEEAE